MALSPSFTAIELEVLVVIGILLFLAAAFFAIFFSAIIGAGLARLLYVGGRFCAKTIHPSFVPVHQPIAVGPKGAKD
jgi:hypothetical protein